MNISEKDRKKYERLSKRWACGNRKLTKKEMHFVLEFGRKVSELKLRQDLANYKAI